KLRQLATYKHCVGVYVKSKGRVGRASMHYFKADFGWLVIIAAASAFAQTDASQNPEICTSDGYAIYTAALTDLYGTQTIERVILIDQTSLGCSARYGGDDAVWRQSATAAQRFSKRG